MSSDIEALNQAKDKLNQLTEDPGNDTKLQLYALYKQATVGTCNTSRPGMMDFVGRAKWDAWNSLGQMTQSDAVNQYSLLVDSLVGVVSNAPSSKSSASSASNDDIIIKVEGGVQSITLNRPSKKNAITVQMYEDITNALNASAGDSNVKATLFTGSGDYYCSGNDLSNFLNIPPEGPEKLASDSAELLYRFVSSFIRYPKPLVASINGPAVGISVTVLCLFDLVYAADHATFHTPFMQLGQSPEGCSSFIYPRVMGIPKANEILMLGRKISAQEAYERNLVTRVLPSNELEERVGEVMKELVHLPQGSLIKSKALLRGTFIELLEKTNREECDLLRERWLSEECMQAIVDFMQKRNK
jgi:peroxisomal 3,2-trans-enoyl-CoA isomerase